MILSAKRSNDPASVDVALSLDSQDFAAAFEAPPDPDEVLYFELFSGHWKLKKVSEQLTILARVAALAEAKAATLNVSANIEQP